MNFKLTILEIWGICFIGIIVSTLIYFLNYLPIVGLGFGMVIVMRYIFELLKEKEEKA